MKPYAKTSMSKRLYFELLRPRTWFLSLAGIAQGAWLAYQYGVAPDLWLFLLCASCALSLQISSNLANDWGDEALDAQRSPQAPRRLLALGWVSRRQVKRFLLLFLGLALVSGLALILITGQWLFAFLGLSALVAALLYSLTPYAYGRRYGGELAVFLFFGWLAVAGSAYLFSQQWHHAYLYLGSSWGSASALVLYMNNWRDAAADAAHGKRTLANALPQPYRFAPALLLLSMHYALLLPYFKRFLLLFLALLGAYWLWRKRFHALIVHLSVAPLLLWCLP